MSSFSVRTSHSLSEANPKQQPPNQISDYKKKYSLGTKKDRDEKKKIRVNPPKPILSYKGSLHGLAVRNSGNGTEDSY
jgi:hypothetical protein